MTEHNSNPIQYLIDGLKESDERHKVNMVVLSIIFYELETHIPGITSRSIDLS